MRRHADLDAIHLAIANLTCNLRRRSQAEISLAPRSALLPRFDPALTAPPPANNSPAPQSAPRSPPPSAPGSCAARRRIRRAESHQISVARVLRRLHHPLLKALVAGKRGVFAAAHLRHFFGHILLECLHRHEQRRECSWCGPRRSPYVVQQLGAAGENETLSTSTSDSPIF